MVDGMFSYRDEDRKMDVIHDVFPTLEDDGLAFTHWSHESIKWKEELERWQKFREAQRIHNQFGRSETELELDNTDVGLVEVLSKLNDWQEFQFIQQKKVHEAETSQEKCQQAITRLQNALLAESDAEATRKVEEEISPWMSEMTRGQKQLETSQEEMMWVKSQWTAVLAEASDSIAAAPKLQKQLEDKFEKQTNSIYHRLQQMGAKPSHAVHSPERNAGFAHRLQHWISESSGFTAELWDWRIFMAWRRRVKAADTTGQEGQKQPSQVGSSPELFEDHVKYCQLEVDKATSWVDCWWRRAKQYAEVNGDNAKVLKEKRERGRKEFFAEDSEDDGTCEEARALAYAEPSVTLADLAQVYAKQAEQRVSDFKKRLEQSKKDLESVLAKCGRPSTCGSSAEDSGNQLQPTPPKSESPEICPKNLRASRKGIPAKKDHRRSKKEKARKRGAKTGFTDKNQQPLPGFTLGSDQVEEDDVDIEMPDISEGPRHAEVSEELEQAELEDAVMSDVEEPPNLTPSSKSSPHPRPTTNTDSEKPRPPSAQGPASRKTRSATKPDRARRSGKILKNGGKKPADKKPKVLTERQTAALLTAASSGGPHAPPRRSERLREKEAAASLAAARPVLDPVESGQSPRQGKPKGQPNGLEPAPRKKTEVQRDAVEPQPGAARRKRGGSKKGASKEKYCSST